MRLIKYLLTSVLLLFTTFTKAESPSWIVIPSNYSYNMTLTSVVDIENVELSNPNDRVAAFVGTECCGVATSFYNSVVNRHIFYLMIYNNTTNAEVHFKAYNSADDEIVDLVNAVNFQINGIIGNAEDPIVLANQHLSSEADILSFNIVGQIQQTINGHNINIVMPTGTDLTSLSATFTISEFSKMFIAITPQISGITVNDFSQPVVYKVVAQNGDFQNWTATVSTEIVAVNSMMSELYVYPNPASEFISINASEGVINVCLVRIYGQTTQYDNSTYFHVSDLENGIYVMVIKTRNNLYVRKTIINH